MQHEINTNDVRESVNEKLSRYFGIGDKEADIDQIYRATVFSVSDLLAEKNKSFTDKVHREEAKQIYYMCMEFLVGRSLKLHLCNLGIEVASPNALSFLNMLKRDPEFAESAELYNQTALAYLRRNDVENARRALVEAWRLGRSDAAINYNAGCFFDRYAKSRPLALKFYRTYMKISENLAAEAAYRTEVAARLAALEEKR